MSIISSIILKGMANASCVSDLTSGRDRNSITQYCILLFPWLKRTNRDQCLKQKNETNTQNTVGTSKYCVRPFLVLHSVQPFISFTVKFQAYTLMSDIMLQTIWINLYITFSNNVIFAKVSYLRSNIFRTTGQLWSLLLLDLSKTDIFYCQFSVKTS